MRFSIHYKVYLPGLFILFPWAGWLAAIMTSLGMTGLAAVPGARNTSENGNTLVKTAKFT